MIRHPTTPRPPHRGRPHWLGFSPPGTAPDQVRRDVSQKARWRITVGAAQERPTCCPYKVYSLFGPGDTNVAEPALLFHLHGIIEGACVRKHLLFHSHHENHREL